MGKVAIGKGEVRYLRLTDGTDLVCKVVDINEVELRVEQPIRLYLVPQTGQVGMMPYLPFADGKEFDIPLDEVKFNLVPDSDMKNMWNEKFGSGLVVPSEKKGIIMPGGK